MCRYLKPFLRKAIIKAAPVQDAKSRAKEHVDFALGCGLWIHVRELTVALRKKNGKKGNL